MARHFSLTSLSFVLLATAVAPALSAPDDPVKAIMDVATRAWGDNPPENEDYFDKDHIGLFSKDFVAAYRAAEKFPLFEESTDPFGYDVVTNSQDGCALKDVTITPGAGTAGATDVKVTFKLMTCYTDDPARDDVSEVHFKVVTEDGKPVIADMDRIVDGKPMSLMAEMQDIVKAGGEASPDNKEQQQ